MPVRDAQQLAETLLTQTREEISRADSKAMNCLQAVGAGGFAVLTLLPGGGAGDWCRWAGAAAWALALLCLAGAVLPRLRGGPAEAVTFFGHVVRLRRPARVQRCIEAAAADHLPGLVAQLCASSRIAMVKYRLIRLGLLCTVGSAAMIALSLA